MVEPVAETPTTAEEDGGSSPESLACPHEDRERETTSFGVRSGANLSLAAYLFLWGFILFNFIVCLLIETTDRPSIQVVRVLCVAFLTVFFFRGHRWARIALGILSMWILAASGVAALLGFTPGVSLSLRILMAFATGLVAYAMLASRGVRDYQAWRRSGGGAPGTNRPTGPTAEKVLIGLVIVLAFTGIGVEVVARERGTDAIHAFRHEYSRLCIVLRREIAENGTFRGDLDFFRAMEEECERRSADRRPPMSFAYAALAKHYRAALPMLEEQAAIMEGLAETGGSLLAGIKDLDAISARMELIERLIAVNEESTNYQLRGPGLFASRLDGHGLNRKQVSLLVSAFMRGAGLQSSVEIARCDRESLEAIGEGLLLLREEWGHWSYGREGGTIRFENPRVEEIWADLMRRQEAAVRRQREIQQKLFSSLGQQA